MSINVITIFLCTPRQEFNEEITKGYAQYYGPNDVHEGVIFINRRIYNGADIIVFTIDEHRIIRGIEYFVERNAA